LYISYTIILKIQKKLKKGLKSNGGRNNTGKVCVRGRGAGNKITYRFLDFYRRINKRGRVLNISYDPIRTGKIGLVIYENGLSSYILLQKGVKIDTMIYAGSFLNSEKVNKGDSVLLKYIPLFSIVSNMENKPYKGSSLCRAAGVGAVLIGKKKKKEF